jgi:hypothetical protein
MALPQVFPSRIRVAAPRLPVCLRLTVDCLHRVLRSSQRFEVSSGGDFTGFQRSKPIWHN